MNRVNAGKCLDLVRDQGVGGSNPLSPTIQCNHLRWKPPTNLVSCVMTPAFGLRTYPYPQRASKTDLQEG